MSFELISLTLLIDFIEFKLNNFSFLSGGLLKDTLFLFDIFWLFDLTISRGSFSIYPGYKSLLGKLFILSKALSLILYW